MADFCDEKKKNPNKSRQNIFLPEIILYHITVENIKGKKMTIIWLHR